VTDADVVLGKIEPARFAGGAITLYPGSRTRRSTASVGKPLSLSTAMAAHGVAEIVDENMANAARVHSVERGVVVVGPHAGRLRWRGAAPCRAPRRETRHRPRHRAGGCGRRVGGRFPARRLPPTNSSIRKFMRLDKFDLGRGEPRCSRTERRGDGARQAAAGNRKLTETSPVFMRYAGQGHEIAVALPGRP
jgi:N-methylhydantoinase A